MDFLAEFRSQPRQVEDIHRKPLFGKHRLGQLYQSPALRHFARAGVFAARRAFDQEDARRLIDIVVASLRGKDGGTRIQPVDGNVIVGIGITRPALRVTGALREFE
jgi:hypothetical protein